MTSPPRIGPKYRDHNGFLMPFGFPSDKFSESLKYEVQDSDIIVTTYPKCGTTWVQNIIYLILHNGQSLPLDAKLEVIFPHLEEVGLEGVEQLPHHPRLIKTHLPYAMTPMNERAKYIYVTRNPKDCLVSFFHHTRGFINAYDYENGTFDEYFELFLNGKVDFGDYFDNLVSWLEHEEEDHILFLTYESLKEDTRSGVLKIANFLGKEYHEALLQDDETILKAVLDQSSFGSMSKDTQRWSSERPEGHTSFIRKGQVGDWKNHFSDDQSKRMNDKIKARLTPAQQAKLWPNAQVLMEL